MRTIGRYSLGLVLSLLAASAPAEEVQWRSAGSGVTLRRPIPLTGAEAPPPPSASIQRVSYVARGQAPGGPVPAVPPPPPPPPFAGGPPGPSEEGYNCGVANDGKGPGGFFSGVTGAVGNVLNPCGRSPFQSDHGFDSFISPVSSPFLFQDPRALTEVRPIFIWQQTPRGNPVFSGGDIEYAGVQARVAFTERLSLVINKLGFIWLEPHTPPPGVSSHFGFSEVHLGPQYTFYRPENGSTLIAAGLNFELALGPHKVFQDTGDLSLTPYLSFGQEFGRSTYGTFHFLNTTGYSFGVDNQRTDLFFSNFHLDYDIGGLHKIYPLVELNYFHYPFNGGATPINFEGRDLINFGSTMVAGNNDLSIAVGARYLFSQAIQLGGAFEIPLLNRKDLMDFRLTFDVIFRY